MNPCEKHHQPSLDSVLRQIPVAISPRCKRSRCIGPHCEGWNSCGPATPGGGYRVHLNTTRTIPKELS
jgi:hypothetical protein